MKTKGGLYFGNIDASDLNVIADQLGATLNQVRYALHRALRRTEANLRKSATTELKKELNLRAAFALKKRIRSLKIKSSLTMKKDGSGRGDVGVWFGLNDMPVSAFKGTPKEDPAGAFLGDYFFEGAFVGRSEISSKKTIFKRAGKRRIPIREQTINIHESAMNYIEDNLFERVEELFWNHFRRDLAARIKYQLGGL